MYNMNTRIVGVEIPGNQNVSRGFRRKVGEKFVLGCWFLCAEKKSRAGAVFVCVCGLVSLELLLILLFMLVKVGLDL
jgi:hypothetical protein